MGKRFSLFVFKYDEWICVYSDNTLANLKERAQGYLRSNGGPAYIFNNRTNERVIEYSSAD